jgi:hypothetical protein
MRTGTGPTIGPGGRWALSGPRLAEDRPDEVGTGPVPVESPDGAVPPRFRSESGRHT